MTWAEIAGSGVNPGRVTAALRSFVELYHGQPIRCVQEPAWPGRPPGELCEAVRHEALINLAPAGVPVSLLCEYHLRLEAGLLSSAERAHPTIIRDGRCQPSRSYDAAAVIPREFDQPLPPAPAARPPGCTCA